MAVFRIRQFTSRDFRSRGQRLVKDAVGRACPSDYGDKRLKQRLRRRREIGISAQEVREMRNGELIQAVRGAVHETFVD